MAANMDAFLGPDLVKRQREYEQRARLAQALMSQKPQPQSPQMVSGHYVGPDWGQRVNQAFQTWGMYQMSKDLAKDGAELQADRDRRLQLAFGLGAQTPQDQMPPGSPQVDEQAQSGGGLTNPGVATMPNSGTQIPIMPGLSRQQAYMAFTLDPSGYMKEYAKRQGDAVAPTQLQRNLQGAGLQPGSPEYQRAILENVNPGQRPTALMQNIGAAGLIPGTPEYRDAILAGTKNGTTVNVGAGEKAWDTESAKLFAKRYDDISAGAMNAQQMLGMYDLAEQALNSGVRTGIGAEAELSLRQLGSAMGIDTDPDKLAGGELIRAVQNRMALTMRSPDGGMGMPGALSDRDIKFLKDSQVGIDRSPEGNRRMLQAFRAMEARKIDIARLADEYIAEHGRLDAGFNRAVREYADANPLFQPEGGDRMMKLDQLLGL